MVLACISLSQISGGDSALLSNIDNRRSDLDPPSPGLLVISRGTAILLFAVYIAYLFFQVCPRLVIPLDISPHILLS